jgi:hypothetical protein
VRTTARPHLRGGGLWKQDEKRISLLPRPARAVGPRRRLGRLRRGASCGPGESMPRLPVRHRAGERRRLRGCAVDRSSLNGNPHLRPPGSRQRGLDPRPPGRAGWAGQRKSGHQLAAFGPSSGHGGGRPSPRRGGKTAWPKPLRPMERTGIEPVTSGLQSPTYSVTGRAGASFFGSVEPFPGLRVSCRCALLRT